MGKLKKRIRPSDITINIGKDAPIPECPIRGERFFFPLVSSLLKIRKMVGEVILQIYLLAAGKK